MSFCKILLCACGLLFVMGGPTVRAEPPQTRDLFKEWDKDDNGRLTREELPERLRKNFDRGDANRDGSISRQEHEAFGRRRQGRRPEVRHDVFLRGVNVTRDIPYASTDNPRQRLDLFLPERRQTDKPLPVVAFIHGGGWRGGDKASGARMVAPYVQTGKFAAVSIGYRLSGESQWPAQIHDCKAAIRWIKAHSEKHGLDGERIAVWGTSAGGHLVAMLGVAPDVDRLEGKLGDHTDQNSRVACVVDWFGPADFLSIGDHPSKIDHNSPTSPESLLLGGPVQQRKDVARNASPITHVSAGDSPFLIVHGTRDQLVPYDQSVRFHESLRGANVSSILIAVEGAGHGRFESPEVGQRVRLFLEQRLLGKDVKVPPGPIKSPRRAP